MADITEEILESIESIPPSVLGLLEFEEYVSLEVDPGEKLEWFTNEIAQHTLHWVRVGIVAEFVRRKRIYRQKFRRWQDYCQKAIGKSTWQIQRYINSAKVVIELARAGFTTLPSCEAQASKLVRYLDKSFFPTDQKTLCDKWKQVITRLPKHCITHAKIDEELGHVSAAKKVRIGIDADVAEQIKHTAAETRVKPADVIKDATEHLQDSQDELWGLPEQLRQRIENEADRTGLSVAEVMARILDAHLPAGADEPAEPGDVLEDVQTCTVSPKKIARWKADLDDLIETHDSQLWFSCWLLKLSPWQLVPK